MDPTVKIFVYNEHLLRESPNSEKRLHSKTIFLT